MNLYRVVIKIRNVRKHIDQFHAAINATDAVLDTIAALAVAQQDSVVSIRTTELARNVNMPASLRSCG